MGKRHHLPADQIGCPGTIEAVPLARVSLVSGRSIDLTGLEISSTYAGLLEGYPNARINDALLKHLGRRREFSYGSQPVHLITPLRSQPEPESVLPFGPMETLPPVYCQGSFRSAVIGQELDPVLYKSWLMVVWFQDDLARPVAEAVAAAVSGLAWDECAENYEL